jgi:hypothetical protein
MLFTQFAECTSTGCNKMGLQENKKTVMRHVTKQWPMSDDAKACFTAVA